MKFFTGYVTVRSFNGYALPVPVQNKLLRNYAKDNNMIYVLPQCEMVTDGNYMMLFDTLHNIEKNSNLGMCSIHMLPKNNEKFLKIQKIIKDKELVLHFMFEETIIKSDQLHEYYIENNINNLLQIKNKDYFKEHLEQ
tara:strand:+ start:42044 stop:42457 length:414 start_codon:yes stop_codon:yes gene_type:complete